jgi:hypothetical protein
VIPQKATAVNRILLGIVLLALTTLIVLLLLWEKPISWSRHYQHNSKDPYGTRALHTVLQQRELQLLKKAPAKGLPSRQNSDANYLFIGDDAYFSAEDATQILRFTAAGNRVFMFTPRIPPLLLPEKTSSECLNALLAKRYVKDSTASMNLLHPALKLEKPVRFQVRYENDIVAAPWSFFSDDLSCYGTTQTHVLGLMNNAYPNFIRIAHGKGFLFFHAAPVVLSNIQLLRPEAQAYLERILTHLGTGPIYWDVYSNKDHDHQTGTPVANQGFSNKHPLRYIVSQPPLAWAWYLLVTMAILLVSLYAKRKQRIIPVMEPRINTSLEFVSAIGRLHFIQHNHRQLSLSKSKLFQLFVRERYGLVPGMADYEQKLSAKSGLPSEFIQELISTQQQLEQAGFVSESQLVSLHKITEQFYQRCK